MSRENIYLTQNGYKLSDKKSTGLTKAMEDYLEMIYRLSPDAIRVNNLAAHLRVTPSSVSRMANDLRLRGLVSYKRYGVITLTEDGRKMGAFLLWRHNTVCRLLSLINGEDVNPREIEQTEHFLSPVTVENIEVFLEWLSQ